MSGEKLEIYEKKETYVLFEDYYKPIEGLDKSVVLKERCFTIEKISIRLEIDYVTGIYNIKPKQGLYFEFANEKPNASSKIIAKLILQANEMAEKKLETFLKENFKN